MYLMSFSLRGGENLQIVGKKKPPRGGESPEEKFK